MQVATAVAAPAGGTACRIHPPRHRRSPEAIVEIVGVSPVNQMAVGEYESLIVMQSLAQLAQGYLLPNLPRLA